MKKGFAIILVGILSVSAATAGTVALPPFTYTGRLMNNLRVAYTEGVTIYARNTNGVLLARAPVFAPDISVRNYALSVPLASAPTEKTAVVGERLVFEVDDGSTLWVEQALMPDNTVGNPGAVAVADIVLVTDTNGNGVDDTYESMIETLRYELDGLYEQYDANADYDKDGVPNGQEYLAGTDPLSDAETFVIDEMQNLAPTIAIQSSRAVIRFYATRGRTYSVVSSTSLDNPQWQAQPFRLTDSESAAVSEVYYSPASVEQEGSVIFYVPSGAEAMFYRLRVE
ncbi:MAG: hypothetical protein PHU80_04365 [Kiritimatiellae bacterium]|nr:hypothetical protein [Kiritimatiellia bacterium]